MLPLPYFANINVGNRCSRAPSACRVQCSTEHQINEQKIQKAMLVFQKCYVIANALVVHALVFKMR